MASNVSQDGRFSTMYESAKPQNLRDFLRTLLTFLRMTRELQQMKRSKMSEDDYINTKRFYKQYQKAILFALSDWLADDDACLESLCCEHPTKSRSSTDASTNTVE